MTLFNKHVDWLVVAGPTVIAIYLFYGSVAALISLVAIGAVVYAKPLEATFSAFWPKVIFACGVVLLLSPFFRTVFTSDFCVGAPMAPLHDFARAVSGMGGLDGLVGSELAQGLYSRCMENYWGQAEANGGSGWPRDYLYPIVGAAGLVFGLLKRDRNVSL